MPLKKFPVTAPWSIPGITMEI